MLKRLFTSKVRIKLLKLFLTNPDKEFFIRELTRKLDEQINSVRRELDNLKKVGLLTSKSKNRKKYYQVDTSFMFYNELRSMMLKAMNTNEDLVKSIQKLGKIELLILSGVFLNKEAEADLLLVGDVNKDHLAGIALEVEHAFTEKGAAQRHPINTADQPVATPALDAVGAPEIVEFRIGADDFTVYPGVRALRSGLGAASHDTLEGGIAAHLEDLAAHRLGQALRHVKSV